VESSLLAAESREYCADRGARTLSCGLCRNPRGQLSIFSKPRLDVDYWRGGLSYGASFSGNLGIGRERFQFIQFAFGFFAFMNFPLELVVNAARFQQGHHLSA
jgi:hypothetical protein